MKVLDRIQYQYNQIQNINSINGNTTGIVPISWRLIVSLVFFSVSFGISGVGAAISRLRFPKGSGCSNEWGAYCDSFPSNTTNPPLPDILYSLVPFYCDTNANFPSFLLLAFMILTLICLMIFGNTGRSVLIRFCVMDGVLLLLRTITISFTQLNNPSSTCNNCGGICPNNLWDSLVQTFMYPYPLGTCGDYMFSGHTVHYLLMALSWQTYMRASHPTWSPIIEKFLWLLTMIGISSLISCRIHYSDDIIIAIILTTGLWKAYNYYINNPPSIQERKNSSYLTQFIMWIEQV